MMPTPMDDTFPAAVRLAEAVLFASAKPVGEADLAARLPEGSDVRAILAALSEHYRDRGVNLVQVAGAWALRTAPDLAGKLAFEVTATRKLSRAATETLAIIAYHQPVTRAEIEHIRGVSTNRGTIDQLLEAEWIRPGRRRQTPGRPLTWVTTPTFLDYFGLAAIDDLPGLEDLRAAGLLDRRSAISVLSDLQPDAVADEPEDEDRIEERTYVGGDRDEGGMVSLPGAPAIRTGQPE